MEAAVAEIEVQKYEAYKESDVEWLGEIPAHWEVVRSKALFQERKEKARKADKQLTASQKYGMISQEEFMEKEGRRVTVVLLDRDILKHIEANDFVISMRSFQGGLEYSNLSGCVSSAYIPLIPIKHVVPEFFKYLFKSDGYIKTLSSTSNLVRDGQAMRFENFAAVPLLIVPKTEQTAIANFLDRKTAQIDQAIAQKERLIELLQERRQILIQRAVTRGLRTDVPMKDSGVEGIGETPSHWKILFNRRLFRENSRKIVGVELPLSLSQVDGVIPSEEMKERSLSPAHRDNFKLCLPGDLIVNRFKGHLGVFFQSAYRGIVTFHYGVFEPAVGVNSKYYELLFHTEAYKTIYAGASNGMTVGLQNLSNNNFYNIKSIVPPLDEQNEIVVRCEKVTARVQKSIDATLLQIEQLREYKSTLINAAVTGKIKVG